MQHPPRRASALTAILAAAGLLFAACGSDSGGSDTAGKSDGGGSGGSAEVCDAPSGSLTVGTFSEPTSLNPTIASGKGTTGGMEMIALYDTLMRHDAETNTYEPRLAESLEANDDATVWTLTLRDGITFGNGDPVDAEAVKASIELVQADTNSQPTRDLALRITDMKPVDEKTLEITLDDSWPGFPYLLASTGGMIVNVDLLEERGEAFATNPEGAGAGPYEFERFAPGEEIVLRAKTDYWGDTACTETLRFVNVPGGQATLDAFENGELDIAFLRDPTVIADARDAGIEDHAILYNLTSILLLKQEEGAPTADLTVRRAIAAAIDPEFLDDRANGGNGFPTSALVHPDSPLADIVDAGDGPGYDPDLAKQLVEDAKADGWDGHVRVVSYNTPDRVELSLAVEAQLRAAGMDVEVDNQNSVSEFITKVRVDGAYELAVWGLFVDNGNPWVALDGFRSDGAQNVSGYGDPDMDEALLELKHAADDAETAAAMERIQEIWNDTIPAVAWAAAEDVVITADGVEGLVFSQDTLVYLDRAR